MAVEKQLIHNSAYDHHCNFLLEGNAVGYRIRENNYTDIEDVQS